MATSVPEIKTVSLEVRVGGRFGPPRKDGRRGAPLFRVEVPESLRTWLADIPEFPLPEGVTAVFIYWGEEVLRTWTNPEHDRVERAAAKAVELDHLDAQIVERRHDLRVLEDKKLLAERALELLQAQVGLQQANLVQANQAIEALRTYEASERARVQGEVRALDEWVGANRKRAVDELGAFGQAVETQIKKLGAIVEDVLEREGRTAAVAASRGMDTQNQVLLQQQLLGDVLQRSREGLNAQLLQPQTGPSTADKMVNLVTDFMRPGGIVDRTIERVFEARHAEGRKGNADPGA